jgi:hypothetical protein
MTDGSGRSVLQAGEMHHANVNLDIGRARKGAGRRRIAAR